MLAEIPIKNLPTTATISVGGKQVKYQSKDKTLLKSLENADIDIHTHCRDGYCGACRMTLKSGEVSYPNGEPLAYIAHSEILPCCCVPTSDLSLALK